MYYLSGKDLQKKMTPKGRVGNWRYGYVYDKDADKHNKYTWVTCNIDYRYVNCAVHMSAAIDQAQRRQYATDNVHLWIMNEEPLYNKLQAVAHKVFDDLKRLSDKKLPATQYNQKRSDLLLQAGRSLTGWIKRFTGKNWTPDGIDWRHHDVELCIELEVSELFLQAEAS